jgi:quinol monooxygenase YgiN
MSEHAQMIRVLVLRPAAGKRSELVKVCEEAAERARKLEGNFGVQVCDVREDPGDVCVISRWADASGAERMQKLNQEYRPQFEPLLGGAPRLYHMTPIEGAS